MTSKVHMELSAHGVTLNPSLQHIQDTIDTIVKRVCKHMACSNVNRLCTNNFAIKGRRGSLKTYSKIATYLFCLPHGPA